MLLALYAPVFQKRYPADQKEVGKGEKMIDIFSSIVI
jgi:hypothetical protein